MKNHLGLLVILISLDLSICTYFKYSLYLKNSSLLVAAGRGALSDEHHGLVVPSEKSRKIKQLCFSAAPFKKNPTIIDQELHQINFGGCQCLLFTPTPS